MCGLGALKINIIIFLSVLQRNTRKNIFILQFFFKLEQRSCKHLNSVETNWKEKKEKKRNQV